ncbi:MAG: hypothetical protein PHS30_04050 [Bacteroidales bacterium]|nr:hypothetical protein [Bacteroidales bacterium]
MYLFELSKQYEFFLTEFRATPRAGGPKFKLIWSCVDHDYEIVEWPALNDDGTPGPRLTDLMTRLGAVPDVKGVLPQPEHFFRKGMHIFTELQRHWVESRNESISYEFVYDSISLTDPTQQQITEGMKMKVKFLTRKHGSLQKARAVIKSDAPELLSAFDIMSRTGELVTE